MEQRSATNHLGKKAYSKLNEVILKQGVLALLFLSGVLLVFN
jgi:hypothetical protein